MHIILFFFIQNAVIRHKDESATAFDFVLIEKLLSTVYSEIDKVNNEKKIANNLIYVSSDTALKILELHRKFVIDVSFYYLKSIKPEFRRDRDERMMDGFINFMPTENRLSSGQNALLNLFSRLFDLVHNHLNPEHAFMKSSQHYILLLDEVVWVSSIWKKNI
ncbi:MAG: hypothetical protein IPH46_16095 [Bacteroidetes bacterium]|nr:hypothetical protein [Bacteroidota bacterium]